MSRPMRFILLAVLLALPGAWWALHAASGEPSPPSATGAHASPVPSAPPSPPAPQPIVEAAADDSDEPEDGGDEEEEDYEDEAEGTGPCISVEVTARGVPVPGAHVTAARREDEHSYLELKPLDVGPDGRGQAWCAPGTYLLAAHAPGFAPSVVKIDESAGSTPALARIQLQPGNSVSGRVLDKDSQEPVAQAQVTLEPIEGFSIEGAETVLSESTVTSDARGAFQVGDLTAGMYRVTAEAPGHSSNMTDIKVPRPEPLTLELEGTSHLEGVVVDAAGALVPGARVWAGGNGTHDDDEPAPVTDAKGHFSLEVEEGTYTLIARAGSQTGVHEGRITIVRGGLVDGLVIRLHPSGSMSGKVFLKSTQAPVAHEIISIRQEDLSWGYSAQTDEQGTFRVKDMLPGTYGLTLYGTDLPQTRREELHVEADQELVVELPVILDSKVEGRVTDGLGRPVEDASVTVVAPGAPPREQVRHWSASDEDGQYSLSGLNPGSYRLEARWSSAAKPLVQEVTVREGETTHVDLAFPDVPSEVQGTVQRTSGGPPRYSVRVSAVSSDANNPEHQVESTTEAGHFTLKLLPGTYTLKAEYSETDDSGPEQSVTVEAGKISQVRLTVPDSVTETSGIVLDSRGEPVNGAWVNFSGDHVFAREDSDAQGHFTLKTSRESAGTTGEIRVQNGAEEATVSDVRTGSKDIIVRLSKAAALRGRVSATRGVPVDGFTVQIDRKDNGYGTLRTESPFAGDTFEFVDLPAGEIELLVRALDGRCGMAVVHTEPGQTANVEVSVGTLGRVTGRLLTATGEPRSAWVHVDGDTANPRDDYSSKDGHFEVIALEPGPHLLKHDRGPQIPFTIREGEVLDLGDLHPAPTPPPR